MQSVQNAVNSLLPASLTGSNHTHSHAGNHGHSHHSHTPAEEEAFWEKMAPRYDTAPVAIAGAKINSAAILACLAENGITPEQAQKAHVLEVGGGGGLILPHLLPSFSHIHLTDPSAAMLSLIPAKNLNPDKVSYSRFTITSAASPEKFFSQPMHSPTPEDRERRLGVPVRPGGERGGYDLVYGTMMLHHVEGLEGFLEGCKGMLRKGGVMIFTDLAKQESSNGDAHADHHHNHADHAHSHKDLMSHSAVSRPAEQKHSPGFDPVKLTAQLEALGFVDVRCVTRGTIPMPKDLESGECGESVPLLVVFARKPGCASGCTCAAREQ